MLIPEQEMLTRNRGISFTGLSCRGAALLLLLAVALVMIGCKKEVAVEASDSDSNGYLCLKCGVKLYTARSTFIGPHCPKCNEDTLMDVVGYRCAKDSVVVI